MVPFLLIISLYFCITNLSPFIKDFAEHLKILGYQENIPLTVLNTFSGNVESFRVYANILVWLIKCLDPESMIHQETRSESDRVMLIRSATEFLVNIKCSSNIHNNEFSLKIIYFFYATKITIIITKNKINPPPRRL